MNKSTNFRLFPVPNPFVARLHEIVDFRTPNSMVPRISDARALALLGSGNLDRLNATENVGPCGAIAQIKHPNAEEYFTNNSS